MSNRHHSIKVVAKKTGLSPHVIRVWERRYRVVAPTRTETNRRLYSDEDIERLSLLHQATLAGHSIGNIAQLPGDRLSKLAANAAAAPPTLPSEASAVEGLLKDSLLAIRELRHAPAIESYGSDWPTPGASAA